MGLRKTVNEKPLLIVAVVAVLVLVAGWYAWSTAKPAGQTGGNVYFTDDDGKTFFNGSISDFSPMQRDGKTAYRAYVFKCGDGEPFVGYMERTPEDVIALIKRAKQDPNSISNQEKGRLMMAGQLKQMKKPGEEKWQPLSPAGVSVNCPDGKPATAAD